MIMLALVNNEPKVMNILEMLNYYLRHQEEVVTRRTKYELNKAEERAHILEGLLIALDNIDEVIRIIRNSKECTGCERRTDRSIPADRCTSTGNRRYASAGALERSGTGKLEMNIRSSWSALEN